MYNLTSPTVSPTVSVPLEVCDKFGKIQRRLAWLLGPSTTQKSRNCHILIPFLSSLVFLHTQNQCLLVLLMQLRISQMYFSQVNLGTHYMLGKCLSLKLANRNQNSINVAKAKMHHGIVKTLGEFLDACLSLKENSKFALLGNVSLWLQFLS